VNSLAGYEAWSTASNGGSQGSSSECPLRDTKPEEYGYRRLKCPRCGYKADRDVVGS